MKIRNTKKLNDRLYTSGQPTKEEFEQIHAEGVTNVINLAMPNSDFAILEEGNIVTRLGMNYLHIPIVWEEPKQAQFDLFCAFMHANQDQKNWVHCALNMRVSVFANLFLIKNGNISQEQGIKNIHDLWQPNTTWQTFLENNL